MMHKLMSLGRIWAIATNGFRETLRDRVLYFLGVFTLLFVLAGRWLPEIAANTETKIWLDLGLGAIGGFGALAALFAGTGLVNKEIEKRTLLVILSKPLSRAEWIIGKHLGLWSVLALMLVGMGMIYFGLLSASNISYPFGPLVVSLLYLWLELGLLVAVALTLGSFTSSLLSLLLSFAVYLMGHFSQDLVELGQLSKNSAFSKLLQVGYIIIPDLSRLNLRNEAVYGLLPSPGELLITGCYGLVYLGVLLAIATLIFSRRQF